MHLLTGEDPKLAKWVDDRKASMSVTHSEAQWVPRGGFTLAAPFLVQQNTPVEDADPELTAALEAFEAHAPGLMMRGKAQISEAVFQLAVSAPQVWRVLTFHPSIVAEQVLSLRHCAHDARCA